MYNSANMAILNKKLLLDDGAILKEIGARISQNRINFQLSQARLAEEAGVSKRTIERIESGQSTQMSSMIRVLRVLELLPGLDALIPETGSRPLDLLKLEGRKRRRAYSGRNKNDEKDAAWSWDDRS